MLSKEGAVERQKSNDFDGSMILADEAAISQTISGYGTDAFAFVTLNIAVENIQYVTQGC